MRRDGIELVEIAVRPGDEKRVTFWRDALKQARAERIFYWTQAGYEMYRF